MPSQRRYHVDLTFTEDLLGTIAKDPEVYASYIASKAPEGTATDELESVPSVEERGWTGFHAFPDGRPFIFDYIPKGYLKDCVGMLNRAADNKEERVGAHKKLIDGLIFVFPRRIPLILPAGGVMGKNERPLRAQTAQGERIALARSDTCPAGTTMAFDMLVLGKEPDEKTLNAWLWYGQLRGLGAWRNASWGRFTHVMTRID